MNKTIVKSNKKSNGQTQADSKMMKVYKKLAYETPVLKKLEEFDLLKKVKDEDCQISREKIVNAYLRTVISLSKKYCFRNNLNLDECVQTGIVGILNALENFDLEKYVKVSKTGPSLFSYFCYRSILMSLKEFYRLNLRQFSVSCTTNTRLTNINKLYKSGVFNTMAGDPEKISDYISKELDIKKKECVLLLNLFKPGVELDSPLNSDDERPDPHSYKDVLLKSFDDESPDSVCEREDNYKNLMEILDSLPKEERALIYHKFGINCKEHTFAQIGKKYNMNSQSARNKIVKVQKKLKSLILAAV